MIPPPPIVFVVIIYVFICVRYIFCKEMYQFYQHIPLEYCDNFRRNSTPFCNELTVLLSSLPLLCYTDTVCAVIAVHILNLPERKHT